MAIQPPLASQGVEEEEAVVATAKRMTCTDHCATCGRHFHGLTAFDAHRKDGECLEPSEVFSEKGRQKLQAWTEDGWCDKQSWHDGKRTGWDHPVTVWQGLRPMREALT